MSTDADKKNEDNEKQAVALQYDGESAPRVSASGSAALAEEIIAIAREHKVPLYENPTLVKLLAELELGEQIPSELYLCIAQLIAFAYKVQGKCPPNWTEEGGVNPEGEI